jgi:hypothetical protein
MIGHITKKRLAPPQGLLRLALLGNVRLNAYHAQAVALRIKQRIRVIRNDASRTVRTLDHRLDTVNRAALPKSARHRAKGRGQFLAFQREQPERAAPLFLPQCGPAPPETCRFFIVKKEKSIFIQCITGHGQIPQNFRIKPLDGPALTRL